MPEKFYHVGESRFALEIVDARRHIVDESADGQPAICRILGPADNESLVLSALLEAQEFPWAGEGPSVEEAGGESILVRDGDVLRLAGWWQGAGKYSRWMYETDIECAKTSPDGWRRMPKVTVEKKGPPAPARRREDTPSGRAGAKGSSHSRLSAQDSATRRQPVP